MLHDAVGAITVDGALVFKGVVPDMGSLPNDAEVGHFYHVGGVPGYFAWNGSTWQEVGAAADVDLDGYLKNDGDTMKGHLSINKGSKPHPQWKISPNAGNDYATNIYSLEGQMRFRTSHTGLENNNDGSHIVLDPDVAGGGTNQTTKIYKIPTPTKDDMAANKAYVDSRRSKITVGNGTPSGVEVGDMWFNSNDNNLYIKRS